MVIGMRQTFYGNTLMSIVRFMLFSSVGCLLAMTSGCARAGFWSYTFINGSEETYTHTTVNFNEQSWGAGDVSPPGGSLHIGVFRHAPKAVTISFASKDGRRHKIYVVVPVPPAHFNPQTYGSYFVVEGRCKAIATWNNPDFESLNVFWSCARGGNGTERFSDVTLRDRLVTFRLNPFPSHATSISIVKGDRLRAVDVSFKSKDGVRHTVHVILPARHGPNPPDIHLFIKNADKVIETETYAPVKHLSRWFCAIGDNGKQAFSKVTVTGHGKSYPLGHIGPKSDASLSAIGPMPRALTVGFTSPDGKRHKVRVQAAAATTFHGTKTPELYVLIGSHAKLSASWICPPLLKYKPPPHWTCSISYTGAATISHVTIAYHGTPPYTVADVIGTIATGLTMNPKGLAPKVIDLGFTTSDGKRHTVHLTLPMFHGSGQPSFTLTIEKGGKVVVTSGSALP